MDSIGEACNELKKDYDACFNTWFSEHFLKGHTNDSMCAPLFKVYQECVKRAMKDQQIDFHEVEKNLLGTEQERKPPQKNS
ncbi:TP53-regulated inhibitor of apoptosis 1 [Tribolium castaneum]|uniref:TP53-regulated inhibitor of apoptosis 1-like Protein n=1 Tax=Tribolium castaneum TaxID=7070 RepID=A0A139W968_TRICA|nr:PREDICTED: TP53-regulated inhibitor of apoptosis 1-like [Tribolium castaneum]KXZ75834.1 TP53-regulated inhibitor of apoptosis 1-like Protein [Tribolium castaneum]|eukprot:XP_967370.2 PREDICTED: TP53-regulated inhibitor of apoptosis 1-like [Tribolium castaneum]